MLKAIVYARVSTQKQAEKEISIPAQIELAKKYAQENDIEIVKIFADEGISGTVSNRPAFQEAIQFCKEEKIPIFLVYDTSRFSRDRIDAAFYKRQLRKHGTEVVYFGIPIPKVEGATGDQTLKTKANIHLKRRTLSFLLCNIRRGKMGKVEALTEILIQFMKSQCPYTYGQFQQEGNHE